MRGAGAANGMTRLIAGVCSRQSPAKSLAFKGAAIDQLLRGALE